MVKIVCTLFLLLAVFMDGKAKSALPESVTFSISSIPVQVEWAAVPGKVLTLSDPGQGVQDPGDDAEDREEGSQSEGMDLQAVESAPEATSDLVLFFGRFHPFLVHLPIGFLLFAFLLECAASFKRYEQLQHAVPFALLMGVLSGLATGATGYMLSLGGGYGEDLLFSHKWFGVSVIVLSLTALILRVNWYGRPFLKQVYRFTLAAMVVTVMAAGHFGGSLTHGSDYLLRYMPEPLRSLMGAELEEEEQIALIEDLDTARVYGDIIAPIIRTRCESCHNPDRREGELLMTSFDQLMSGGENGPVIVAYQTEESELYRRLTLPERDEDRMPPRGRRQLTNDQIKLLAWWIDQGVPYGQLVLELEISGDISGILHKLTVDGQSFFDKTAVPPPDEDVLGKLREYGFRIAPVAEGMHFLQVRLSNSISDISAEGLDLLLPLAQQITWLDLARLSLTDDDLSLLSRFKHLTRLNLPHTQIGNRTLEKAGTLEHLEYLNVYGTAVSDEGLKHLENLENLNSLYLWQTAVSREAIADLQDKLPGLYINLGYEQYELTENGERSGPDPGDAE